MTSRWRRSRPKSRPCGRNSIRSTIVSRRTPRPIAAGVWLEERPVREDRLREPPEALLDADACLRARVRSEEHTSELQSRGHLVCRLLLEKKKKITEKVRLVIHK